MIDIRELRKDVEAFKATLRSRRLDLAVIDQILELDQKKREVQFEVESLRAQKNTVSKEIGSAAPADRTAKILAMKEVGDKLKALEGDLEKLEQETNQKLILIPNPAHSSVPVEAGEAGGEIIKLHGEMPKFDFPPKDHLDVAEPLGLLEIPRASRLSGSRFSYLMGDLVHLQFGLVRFAMDILSGHGFLPVIPPVMVREKAMYGTGFFPADANEIYKMEGEDLYLVGTSEVPLAGLHMDEMLPEEVLPLRYAGYSSCFRREAGTYGKDTRGMFRVHQFDKVEMFSFCHPDKSVEEHDWLLSVQEEILKKLGFHYRVINIVASDLGYPAAKKYDLEAWLPGQNAFREVTSCSNCTDYQARRLNSRLKGEKGTRVLHTLNGTAIALGRTMIAILENFQEKDGTVRLPSCLSPYLPRGLEKLTPGRGIKA